MKSDDLKNPEVAKVCMWVQIKNIVLIITVAAGIIKTGHLAWLLMLLLYTSLTIEK